MKRLLLLLLAAAMVFAACKKDDAPLPNNGGNGGGNDSADYKGLGKSTEDPVGAPFTLPAGVTLSGYRYSDSCYIENFRNRRGAGMMVRFCLTLTNNTNQPVPVRLPPCTFFISTKKELQHGILLIKVEELIGAYESETILLELFCTNKERGPSDWGAAYKQGPVSNNKEIKDLAQLLEGKEHLLTMTGNESNPEFLAKVERLETVQEALWEITDGSGKLTDYHRQKVKGIH